MATRYAIKSNLHRNNLGIEYSDKATIERICKDMNLHCSIKTPLNIPVYYVEDDKGEALEDSILWLMKLLYVKSAERSFRYTTSHNGLRNIALISAVVSNIETTYTKGLVELKSLQNNMLSFFNNICWGYSFPNKHFKGLLRLILRAFNNLLLTHYYKEVLLMNINYNQFKERRYCYG